MCKIQQDHLMVVKIQRFEDASKSNVEVKTDEWKRNYLNIWELHIIQWQNCLNVCKITKRWWSRWICKIRVERQEHKFIEKRACNTVEEILWCCLWKRVLKIYYKYKNMKGILVPEDWFFVKVSSEVKYREERFLRKCKELVE